MTKKVAPVFYKFQLDDYEDTFENIAEKHMDEDNIQVFIAGTYGVIRILRTQIKELQEEVEQLKKK